MITSFRQSAILVVTLFLVGWIDHPISLEAALFQKSEPKQAANQSQTQKKQSDTPMKKPALLFEAVSKVNSEKLNEISGVCHSSYRSDEIWVHNDSGGKPKVYLLDKKGKKKLEVTLKGAKNKDWEDICCFRQNKRSYLLVGDFGDNAKKRDSVKLYIFEEPDRTKFSKKKIEVELTAEVEFQFEDGPRNCESVATDGKYVYLFSKGAAAKGRPKTNSCNVYTLPLNVKDANQKLTARIIGKLDGVFIPTAADMTLDGRHLVVRDYVRIFYYHRACRENWVSRLKKKPHVIVVELMGTQTEAIGFDHQQTGLWTVSEGKKPKLWRTKKKK